MSPRRSLEEVLARQAVARIRRWLCGKARGEKREFSPRLAVKFCGGCNPELERDVVAKRIREELAEAVTWVRGDEEKDFLVVINGCKTACAEMPEREKRIPAVVIRGEAVFSEPDS